MLIYKILLPSEWAAFTASGRFDGSAFDLSSGFIHCSSRAQVGATALRVFNHEAPLVVAAIDDQVIQQWLRWEPAPNGGPFPHVYGPLPLSAVAAVHHVPSASSIDEILPPIP